MDVKPRSVLESVKMPDPPCAAIAPSDPIEKKQLTDIADEAGRAPEMPLDPGAWLAKLPEEGTPRPFLTDERVFSQGDPADAVFYVASGKVRLTVKSVEGEQAVIAILPADSFFGECCLAGKAARSTTASAVEPSIILRIEKKAMMDLLRGDPKFAERFLTYTIARSVCIEADLVSHLLSSSAQRLARMRGMFAKFEAGWNPTPVTAKMSPESLAGIIGTTSSNVSSLLDEFRELGFIDARGGEMLVRGSLMNILTHDDGDC